MTGTIAVVSGISVVLILVGLGAAIRYRKQLSQLKIELMQKQIKIAELEVRTEAEKRLAKWFENSPIGFHCLDAKGIFTEINDTELRWIGYTREEVVGKMHIGELLTEESKNIMIQTAHRASTEGSSADREYETIRKDGSSIHLLIHEIPIRSPSGELQGYQLCAVDISEQKRREEVLRMSEANFARAQALAQVGHYEIDIPDPRFPSEGMRSMETFRILGRDPARGPLNLLEFLHEFVHPDDRDIVMDSVKIGMKEDRDGEVQFRIVRPDGTIRHVKSVGHFSSGHGVRSDKIFGMLADITDLKLAQEKFIRSESRFRAMIEKTDETIALFSADASFLYASPAVSSLLGYPPDALIGQKVWSYIHPDDRSRAGNEIAGIISVPGSSIVSQVRALHRSGEWRWVEVSETNRLQDPDIGAIIANIRDISGRKSMESALSASNSRLRELSAYLEEVQEKERANIAQALHDEVGQHYAGMQMGIHWLEQRHINDPASVEKTQLMRQLMSRAFGTIRNIIQSLHPPMLDDLGFVGALDALVEDVIESSGLAIEFACTAECNDLPTPQQLALFRGLQEALTNVSRHANATRVKVSLSRDNKSLTLRVADNGSGMVETAREKRGSFGLLGMSERVKGLGGTFEARSELGAGTTISLTVPFRERRQLERM